jgi:N-acetylglutamate synthase
MIQIYPMQAADCDEVIALWKSIEGISIDSSDSPEAIQAYLSRNPGLSFIARDNNELVGAVLGGHDGRRGFLHHLAVAPEFRRIGTGLRLSESVLTALRQLGILKCHLFVRADNRDALAFWKTVGWSKRDDVEMFTKTTG